MFSWVLKISNGCYLVSCRGIIEPMIYVTLGVPIYRLFLFEKRSHLRSAIVYLRSNWKITSSTSVLDVHIQLRNAQSGFSVYIMSGSSFQVLLNTFDLNRHSYKETAVHSYRTNNTFIAVTDFVCYLWDAPQHPIFLMYTGSVVVRKKCTPVSITRKPEL